MSKECNCGGNPAGGHFLGCNSIDLEKLCKNLLDFAKATADTLEQQMVDIFLEEEDVNEKS